MLHNVCQELTRDNVSDFLFLCDNIISRSQREQIKNPCDLMSALEQLKKVAPDNLQFLCSRLKEIHRHDLAQKVDEYCQRCRRQHFGADTNILPKNDILQESSNNVVSLRPARTLEPDDAEPCSRYLPPSNLSDMQERYNVTYEVLQMPIDETDYRHELIPRGITYEDCYPMNKNPRGNVYKAVFKLIFSICCC